VEIAVASIMECALAVDGTPACWGEYESYYDAWQDPLPGPFVQLSGNFSGTICGVGVDQALVCWGLDTFDEVGGAPSGTFTQVSGGADSFCAVATDGSIACWGRCSFGECEPPKGTFVSVSVGYTHACALTPDGSAVCWGLDLFGETVPP
jgi:hypothetical protein